MSSITDFLNSSPNEITYSSSHSLHYYNKSDKNFIPIIYNSNYDIYFFKLECIHPFDTKKWGKIAHKLNEYFKNKFAKCQVSEYLVSPSRMITEDELALVHSLSFIKRMHSSSVAVTKASEVFPLLLCPMFITRRKLLKPIKWQTAGSILGGFMALSHGWAINLGGGFHHCSAHRAEGFCLFADITLTIRYLWQEVSDKLKILIVDCDAHQGNGYARDVLQMNASQKDLVYILDLFNPNIFPGDETAKSAINREIHLRSRIKDKEYLDLLKFHLNQTSNADKFEPNLIIYNAGTDVLKGDPLGNLSVTSQGIAKRDEIVFTHAKQRKCAILMLLSGGYQRTNAEIISSSIRNLFEKNLITPFDK